jgi:hypothetical protein
MGTVANANCPGVRDALDAGHFETAQPTLKEITAKGSACSSALIACQRRQGSVTMEVAYGWPRFPDQFRGATTQWRCGRCSGR